MTVAIQGGLVGFWVGMMAHALIIKYAKPRKKPVNRG